MFFPRHIIGLIVALLACATSGRAIVILDDSWADGTRTDTSLPSESAWYASNGASLNAATNVMTGTTGGGTSRTWWTYFTTNAISPVQLAVGDSLKITMAFIPSGVNANNTSFSFRLGLFDFSSGSRTTADGNSPNGTGVAGYMLSMNFGQTFGANNPLQIRERTTLSSELMGSSGDYTTLSAGGGNSGDPAFSDGVPYTLVFAITRNAAAVTLTTLFTNVAGWSVSHTATDPSNFTDRFDSFALRPANTTQTATTFTFAEFKVELLSGNPVAPSIVTQPTNQIVTSGQNATFTVAADGTAPLAYQWYFNTNTPLANATSATLILTNAQPSDAGGYSVLVTNGTGSVTSSIATLTVNDPVAPVISTQPTNQTVSAGLNASFMVAADGTAPLSYQWYFNTNTPLGNATNPALTLTNVQSANEGDYSVIVTNSAGAVTSAVATLTVDYTPMAPSFTTQPVSLNSLVGGGASFTALATGTTPIAYQWRKDGNNLAGATSSVLNLSNVQAADAGSYVAVATNSVGIATSAVAVLTVSIGLPNSAYNLAGFAQAATGGGVIPDTDPNYRKAYNADDFVAALDNDTLKVIEIMNDLDLGWNEIPVSARTGAFRQNATPSLHPALIASGVTLIDVQDKNGLTIFSANGSTIRHAELNVKRCNNLLIRNLRFDELWEWDEATKGDYDSKDWDFITIDMDSSNIWVDHCDFTQCYDGVLDIKGGSHNITISWCRFLGDDGSTNSFLRQQINQLEQNPSSYAMYAFLRAKGFSVEDIIAITRPQKKGHLVGATEFNSANANLSVTLHHNAYINFQDRIPRLRGGNAHAYNLYVNNTEALAAKRLRDLRVAAMSQSDAAKLTSSNPMYKFNVTLNGAISTEDGAVLVEKCHIIDVLYPVRNNQTDPSDPDYTGKIRALDTIYDLDATTFRGGSEDAGSPLRPIPATVKPFSFNGFPTLPYPYTMNDPTQLASMLTAFGRIGAGELTWAKTNWLKTSYPASIPLHIVSPPVMVGGSFRVSFLGVPNLIYTVDRATNLAGPWEMGYTNLAAGADGLFELIAPHNPVELMRLYRTRYP